MTISVVSCGPSAQYWDGKGYSIGVNDCFKFGKHTDRLIVINDSFTEEREVFIRKNRASDGFFSQLEYWKDVPNYQDIGVMTQFINRMQDGILYHAITSPFVAMSMAYNLGAKEIVLWGCDFTNHEFIKDDLLVREAAAYMRFIELLRFKGTLVYLGHNSGVFRNLIPVKA